MQGDANLVKMSRSGDGSGFPDGNYLVSLQAIDSADGSVAYQTTTQLTKSR